MDGCSTHCISPTQRDNFESQTSHPAVCTISTGPMCQVAPARQSIRAPCPLASYRITPTCTSSKQHSKCQIRLIATESSWSICPSYCMYCVALYAPTTGSKVLYCARDGASSILFSFFPLSPTPSQRETPSPPRFSSYLFLLFRSVSNPSSFGLRVFLFVSNSYSLSFFVSFSRGRT